MQHFIMNKENLETTNVNEHISLGINALAKIALSIFLSVVMLTAIFALKITPIAQAAGGISISKSVVSDTVMAGDVFTYTIVVTNDTTYEVNTVLTDTVPAVATVIDAGSGTLNGDVIVWDDTMSAYSTKTYDFSVQVTQTGDVVNTDYKVKSGSDVTFGTPVTVTVVAGPPSQVTIDAVPNPVGAGQATTITVSLADQYNNPILASTSVTLTYAAGRIYNNASGTFVDTTDVDGYLIVVFDDITTPQTVRVNAQADAYSNYVDVVYTHGPPATISLNTSADTINVQTGQSDLSASVKDAYGNAVTDDSVLFQSSLGHMNTPGAVGLNGAGNAYNVLYAESEAGTAVITLSVGSLTDSSHTVNITPGPPAQIFMSATPMTIPVSNSGAGVSQVSAAVQDQYGNLVEPTVVTFTTLLGTLDGGVITTSEVTVGGYATATLTAGETAGYAQVTAQVGDTLQKDIDIYFQPDAPDSLSLSAVPPHIYADGTTLSTIYATVFDQFGNAVDVPVQIDVTSDEGTILQTPSPLPTVW